MLRLENPTDLRDPVSELLAGLCLSAAVLLICRYLPREVDPLVYNMSHEDPGSVSYSEIGGLSEQIRELREVSVPAVWEAELCQRGTRA